MLAPDNQILFQSKSMAFKASGSLHIVDRIFFGNSSFLTWSCGCWDPRDHRRPVSWDRQLLNMIKLEPGRFVVVEFDKGLGIVLSICRGFAGRTERAGYMGILGQISGTALLFL
jgi:hypothetical protein